MRRRAVRHSLSKAPGNEAIVFYNCRQVQYTKIKMKKLLPRASTHGRVCGMNAYAIHSKNDEVREIKQYTISYDLGKAHFSS